MLNQRPSRTRPQGGVKGGRSHGADNLMETTGCGEPGGAEQTRSQGDTAGLEGLGGADSSCDCGRGGAMEAKGRSGGRRSPTEPE